MPTSEPEWKDIVQGEYYEVVAGSKQFMEKLKSDRIHLDMDAALGGMNEEWKVKLHPFNQEMYIGGPFTTLLDESGL